MSIINEIRKIIKIVENQTIPSREEQIKALQQSVVEVQFVKKDGTNRTMRCTLNMSLIPKDKHPSGSPAVPRKENTNVIRVFDTIIGEWRSYRVDSVTSFPIPDQS